MIFVAEGNVAQQPEPAPQLSILSPDIVPKWLRDALTSYRIQEDFMYSTMVTDPSSIDYSYWDLPVPPRLLEDDVTFAGYIKRLNLPKVDPEKAVLPKEELQRRHWLHNVGSSLQFSQAYVSKNWYQGGNNHLALLFNFYWNVNLNQVYHPNLLFQSSLSYKLGLNSTPQDEVHSYSISEDVLQYNLNTGLKAFRKWFYSLNLQFKTQMLRNYEQNSMKRKASFLSPATSTSVSVWPTLSRTQKDTPAHGHCLANILQPQDMHHRQNRPCPVQHSPSPQKQKRGR